MSQPKPSTSGGAFSIDLERAPQAIKDLENAADQLEDIRQSALLLGKITPPANDPVSRDAATVLASVAVGGQGSFVEAVGQGINRLRELAADLQQELESYRKIEENNVTTIDNDQI